MILLTGATGFVGRHLLDTLKKKFSVRCLLRNKPSVNFSGCEMVYGDVSDRESLFRATDNVDTVIHLAAVVYSVKPDYIYGVNVEGTKNLVHAAIKNKIKKFIYVSSAAVNFTHDCYSTSKREAENILVQSGLRTTILRPAEIFGEGDERGITRLIYLVRNLPVIPVLGRGDYTFQPVYVEDVVFAITQCVASQLENNKIYNIAGPLALTFNEMIDIISELLRVKRLKIHLPISLIKSLVVLQEKFLLNPLISSEQISRITTYNKHWSIDDSIRDLGFNPLNFREGIRETIFKLGMAL